MVRRAVRGRPANSSQIVWAVSSAFSLGRVIGVLVEKTPGQCQARTPLVQRQQDVTLVAEVHEIPLPMAEFRSQMGLDRSEVDRHAVRDRRLTHPVASSTAPLGLALRQLTGQARATSSGAVDIVVDGLRRNSRLASFPFHPPRDLLR